MSVTYNRNNRNHAIKGRCAATAAALCGILTTGAAVTAVTTGAVAPRPAAAAVQIQLVSEKQELELGQQAAREVEAKYQLETGTSRARLVEQIGRKMAAVSGRPNLPWKFRVIKEKSINAFSVPGYVYMHTGLLDAIGNDTAALAGVIAHEVAHTDARHAKEQMEKSTVAGLLGSLLSRGNSKTSGWFNLGANLVMLNYSRDDEFEADKKAVQYMQRTGYDPRGMIRFFEKLQSIEGKRSGVVTFFQTHPSSGDRISRIRQQISAG
jgi:Putative Zn-dependent protease, contains TPR repeats